MILRTTMLAENLVFEAASCSDLRAAAQGTYDQYGATAEWRLDDEGLDDDQRLMRDLLQAKRYDPMQLLDLVEYVGEITGYDVYVLAYYADNRDATEAIEGFQSGDFMWETADSQSAVHEALGHAVVDADYGMSSDLEEYFDYNSFGASRANQTIQMHDGRWFAINDWY